MTIYVTQKGIMSKFCMQVSGIMAHVGAMEQNLFDKMTHEVMTVKCASRYGNGYYIFIMKQFT